MGLHFVNGGGRGDRPIANFAPESARYSRLEMTWRQPLPRYEFRVTVAHDPRARTVPEPARGEAWSIGFVLNVMYERVLVQYGAETRMERTWARPVLDTASATARPFVQDDVVQRVFHPIEVGGQEVRYVEERRHMRPAVNVRYGPEGLGELLDPWSPSGYVPWRRQRIDLMYVDQPVLTVPAMMDGERLRRLEQVVVFRFWIIVLASQTQRTHILGSSPEFTLAAWLEAEPATIGLGQDWVGGSYDLPGRQPRLIRSEEQVQALQSRLGPLRPQPGAGHPPPPRLDGETANDRLEEWVREQGLEVRPFQAPAAWR